MITLALVCYWVHRVRRKRKVLVQDSRVSLNSELKTIPVMSQRARLKTSHDRSSSLMLTLLSLSHALMKLVNSSQFSGCCMMYACCSNVISEFYIAYYNTFGNRSFAVAGPCVWNSLPAKLCDKDITNTTFSGMNLKHTDFNVDSGAQCNILFNCAI